MGKYDKYAKAIKEEIAFNEEQENLHKKHENVPEDTVIIETGNMGKFMLNFIRAFIKTIFAIILIALATVGLLTLIYPETRDAFTVIVTGIVQDILGKVES